MTYIYIWPCIVTDIDQTDLHRSEPSSRILLRDEQSQYVGAIIFRPFTREADIGVIYTR